MHSISSRTDLLAKLTTSHEVQSVMALFTDVLRLTYDVAEDLLLLW
jgi:hypothetical protein